MCDRFKLPADVAFSNLNYSLPPYNHPGKDEFGVWAVPSKGRLRFNFSVDSMLLAVLPIYLAKLADEMLKLKP